MIPLIMKLRVKKKEQKGVNLWIPIFLIWMVLVVLLIVCLPIVLLAGLLFWKQGYGKLLLLSYPLFFILLFSLSGLKLDIESKSSRIFFDFI